MNKLLGDKIAKVKLQIKNRYIAGESVPSIARSFEVSDRNIYYHLGELTPDEKALHAKNSALHSIRDKQQKGKGVDEGGKKQTKAKAKPKAKAREPKPEAEPETEVSLSDFIAGDE